MINFKKVLAEKIAKVTQLDAKEMEDYIEIPPNKEMGDYSFPCFKCLPKKLRRNCIRNLK